MRCCGSHVSRFGRSRTRCVGSAMLLNLGLLNLGLLNLGPSDAPTGSVAVLDHGLNPVRPVQPGRNRAGQPGPARIDAQPNRGGHRRARLLPHLRHARRHLGDGARWLVERPQRSRLRQSVREDGAHLYRRPGHPAPHTAEWAVVRPPVISWRVWVAALPGGPIQRGCAPAACRLQHEPIRRRPRSTA
jgi:hypothetical protein